MIIKEQYLDNNIQCIFTNKVIMVRFIPYELYGYYFNSGYSFLFEEENENINE